MSRAGQYLALSPFKALVRFRTLLLSGATLLDSEWEDVFAIVLQVWKSKQFGDWRRAEEALMLGPDYFRFPPDDPTVFPPPSPPPLPAWRATDTDRGRGEHDRREPGGEASPDLQTIDGLGPSVSKRWSWRFPSK